MIEGSGSVPLNNGSGSRRPKNIRIHLSLCEKTWEADLNIVLAPAAGDLEALLAGPEGLIDGLVLLGSVGAPLPARDLEPLPDAAHQGRHSCPPLHRQHHLYRTDQCCGSTVPDPTFFHPGSEFSIPDPGSASKNLSRKVNPKKLFPSSRKYDPGCPSRIRTTCPTDCRVSVLL
jgi:hypothetical protein